ncbi:hypothetical protein GCM10029992_13720 [Glycomyces albus]
MPAAIPAPERLRVPHQAGAPTLVRRWLRESLPDLPDESRDDLLVCATELVSNAVRHARPLSGGDLCVSVTSGPSEVEVRVVDGGSPPAPTCARSTWTRRTAGHVHRLQALRRLGLALARDGTQEVWARIPVR